jgi:hypothetical protein
MTSRLILIASLAVLMTASPAPLFAAPPAPPIPAGLSGRYSVPGGDGGFIDLRPDGTFNISQGNRSSAGTYSVSGNAVDLTIPGATAPTLQFTNGVLTIGDGVKLPRVGDAAPPPAPGSVTGPAIASAEQMNATRSISNVKQLCLAARQWAGDHQGSFPDSLEQLLTKEYAGADPRVAHCPLLQNDHEIGYVYLGKGLTDSVAGKTILFLSKWSAADGRRVIGREDDSAMVGIPKVSDLPATVGVSIQQPKPASPATPIPNGATPSNAPGARAGGSAQFTLSFAANEKRPGAMFPRSQMPANPEGYFWVVDRPDKRTMTFPVKGNRWLVNDIPGVFHMHVEYRVGSLTKTVSNVLEFTVPPAAAPAP